MTKRAFILGGFKLDFLPDDHLYLDYSSIFERFGWEPKVPNISWRRRTHSEYGRLFRDYYIENKGDENLIIGNSFGAAVAYITAPELKPDILLLASLSPFFKEDIGNFPEKRALWRFGKRRLADFTSYSAHDIADRLDGKRVVYFYGEREKKVVPHLVDRVLDSHSATHGSTLIEIPGAGHRMRDKEYQAGITKWCEENL